MVFFLFMMLFTGKWYGIFLFMMLFTGKWYDIFYL